jgi:hypothetical protein
LADIKNLAGAAKVVAMDLAHISRELRNES